MVVFDLADVVSAGRTVLAIFWSPYLRLMKPPPARRRGGGSNGLEDRAFTTAINRQGSHPPARAAKKADRAKKPQAQRATAASAVVKTSGFQTRSRRRRRDRKSMPALFPQAHAIKHRPVPNHRSNLQRPPSAP